MTKNIQMKYKTDQGDWENLYPKSKGSLIEIGNSTVEKKISEIENNIKSKVNTDDVYTKQEVDQKISSGNTGIPIGADEPEDGDLWFEEI